MRWVIVIFTLMLLICVVASPRADGAIGSRTASALERDAGDAGRISGEQAVVGPRSKTLGGPLLSLLYRYIAFDIPGLHIHVIDIRQPDRDGPLTVQTPPEQQRKLSIGPEKDDWGWDEQK